MNPKIEVFMKKYVSSFLVVAACFASFPCYALVRVVADCSTSDGQYAVSVFENQGIGPVRKPHLIAQIVDSNKNIVANYQLEMDKSGRSGGFERVQYRDLLTHGVSFSLQGTSSQFPYFSLAAEINVDRSSKHITDDEMSCRVFEGTPL
jgi:hypothetical protein